MNAVDILLTSWLALTGASLLYVAWDLFFRTPAMKVMRWGWLLVVAYTGPVGLAVYMASCREPRLVPHEEYVAPLWKQAVGSTIHCLAGDATGVIAAAAITGVLGLPMGADLIVEYVAGFLFGLLIFQALFTKDMLGGSYPAAVRQTFMPEWVSMNAVMAGMAAVMVILMTRSPSAMEPVTVEFWGIMSLATLSGAVLAYPVNVWLVARGLKHGMGTERALGKGGEMLRGTPPIAEVAEEGHGERRGASRTEVLVVVVITLAVLVVGVVIAAVYGDLSMSGHV